MHARQYNQLSEKPPHCIIDDLADFTILYLVEFSGSLYLMFKCDIYAVYCNIQGFGPGRPEYKDDILLVPSVVVISIGRLY